MDNVLDNLGNLNSDSQAQILRIIKAAENELKSGKATTSCNVSAGDELLGIIANQLVDALKRKDQSAASFALKTIQNAMIIRKSIQPYSENYFDKIAAYYKFALKYSRSVMYMHEMLYDTNTALNVLNIDKANLETIITEDKNNIQSLVDSNPAAAEFVIKFNPNDSQKLSDCDGAQELADAYDEFKNTEYRIGIVDNFINTFNGYAQLLSERTENNTSFFDKLCLLNAEQNRMFAKFAKYDIMPPLLTQEYLKFLSELTQQCEELLPTWRENVDLLLEEFYAVHGVLFEDIGILHQTILAWCKQYANMKTESEVSEEETEN